MSAADAGVRTRSQKRARGETLASSFPDVLPDQRRRRKADPEAPADQASRQPRRGRSGVPASQDRAASAGQLEPPQREGTGNRPAEHQEAGPSRTGDGEGAMDKASRGARSKQSKAEGKADDVGSADDEQQVGPLQPPCCSIMCAASGVRVLLCQRFTHTCMEPLLFCGRRLLLNCIFYRLQDKFNAEQALFGRHSR